MMKERFKMTAIIAIEAYVDRNGLDCYKVFYKSGTERKFFGKIPETVRNFYLSSEYTDEIGMRNGFSAWLCYNDKNAVFDFIAKRDAKK